MNKVLIKDNRDGNKSVVIEIRGNKDGVEIVELQLRQIVGDIWHGKLDFGRISNDSKFSKIYLLSHTHYLSLSLSLSQ